MDSGGSLKDFDDTTLAVTYQEVVESDNTSQNFPESNITSLHFPERNNTALQVIERDDTSPNVIYIERDRDPLFANRMLKEAAENDYVLTSKQIQKILGIKLKGKTFNRLGFSFTKIGKDGVYSSYKVERQ